LIGILIISIFITEIKNCVNSSKLNKIEPCDDVESDYDAEPDGDIESCSNSDIDLSEMDTEMYKLAEELSIIIKY